LKWIILLSLFSIEVGAKAWNYRNNPHWQIDKTYEYHLNKLPKSGELKKYPWTGNYWPHSDGGLTYRWNLQGEKNLQKYWDYPLHDMKNMTGVDLNTLSPAEKYDLYLGNLNWNTVKEERNYSKINTQIKASVKYDPSYKIDSWAGICNAWSESTITFNNPKPIIVTGKLGHRIPFGASDIKGLLASMLNMDKVTPEKTIGERCFDDLDTLWGQVEKGTLSEDEFYGISDRGPCGDVNAGAFHVVLTNQIALKDHGFMIDVDRGSQVWNQPVYSYEIQNMEQIPKIHDRAAKGTKKVFYVHVKVHYVREMHQSWFSKIPHKGFGIKDYEYFLELDKDEKIIGGAWSSYERPDYVWLRNSKKWKGAFAPLKKIYTASIKQKGIGINNRPYTHGEKAKWPDIARYKKWAKRSPPKNKQEWPNITLLKKWKKMTFKKGPNPLKLIYYKGRWPNPIKKDLQFINAVSKGNLSKVKKMIDADVRVNAVTKDKRNALLIAAARRDDKMVQLLLANGAEFSIDFQNAAGISPLMAVLNSKEKPNNKLLTIVKELINAGPAWDLKDNQENNILFYAQKIKYTPLGNNIYQMIKSYKKSWD